MEKKYIIQLTDIGCLGCCGVYFQSNSDENTKKTNFNLIGASIG
uniref:Uncharacterized protein n=1 Tax=Candidatus Kentrum eta TaxID=2126337 RepID=A0A450VRC9_9GAMM|nr:MAG: hypothetical protein BECKH772B_GA0070898_107671 [Candidatus Kentron sp. H]VFK07343.1 MAG: hypothetical protein BECKH772B_GA0070898_107682 [Candidatus Kentron sp. H]VFK09000.1 MAG: hypothetical protein BECKH772A_GA0070896_109361 [Candidatus Kentron sp. H]VFK12331.1 MAG: hypothetical protein BECKH772C_GA0070978_109551 [Candidatus Kentron sp. H]